MKSFIGWCWFVIIQVVALALALIGVPLIAVLAATRSWHPDIVPSHTYKLGVNIVSVWNGGRATWLWGNEEDGVWGPGWYNPNVSRWRTFVWSALRNPANNLRFLVSWPGGPWYQKRWHGWYFQAGFRPDFGWPVLSAGRGTGTVL